VMCAMRARLGPLAGAYGSDGVRPWSRATSALTGAGAVALAGAGLRQRRATVRARRSARALAVAGGALTLAGALSTRFAVFRAGFASAEDPAHTIAPQRARVGG